MQEKTVTIILKKKTYQMRPGIPLGKALRILQISSSAHLAIRNGQLMTDDEMLKNGDTIELVAVISGG